MTLTMRPTGLVYGVHAGSIEYGILCGEWCGLLSEISSYLAAKNAGSVICEKDGFHISTVYFAVPPVSK
jgi:hypothetical protein